MRTLLLVGLILPLLTGCTASPPPGVWALVPFLVVVAFAWPRAEVLA